jgi:hypothetical protein
MKKSVVLVLAGLMFNVAAFAVGPDKAPVDCSKIVKELKEKQAAKKNAAAQQPSDTNGTVQDAQ